jgi:PAS domain S-box-containing protein
LEAALRVLRRQLRDGRLRPERLGRAEPVVIVPCSCWDKSRTSCAAEQKLRASERRFVATLSSIGDAVIATDPQGRVTFMNPVAEALTGWAQQEASGRPLPEVFRIVNEDTREVVEDPGTKVFRVGTVVGLANHTVLVARDGRERPIDDCGSPIIDESGGITGAVIVFRDISDRRQIQEALRKTQAELTRVSRLTTLGQLAASIAHEVKQPIGAVVADAQAAQGFLSRRPPALEEAREALDGILAASHRVGEVVDRIRALTKKGPSRNDRLNINEAIREVIELTRVEVVKNCVSGRTELADALPLIQGDRVELQQVILNLIINAIEAMSGMSGNDDGSRELIVVPAKQILATCSSRCEIRVRDWRQRLSSISLTPSTRRSPTAWAWACRSAIPLSKRTAEDCGPRRTRPTGRFFSSHYLSMRIVHPDRGCRAAEASRRARKKVEMRFAHMKRILKLDRLRLRGLSGAKDEDCSRQPHRT